jgi:D-alanyl-D-alanine carboxypeptidase
MTVTSTRAKTRTSSLTYYNHSMYLKSILKLFLLAFVLTISITGQIAQPSPDIQAEVEAIRKEYDLPAMAAAVVRTDARVDKTAVGVRIFGKPERVTIDDRFHMGSVGKSMTATMIAALVEEGKLSWSTTLGNVFGYLGEKLHPSLRGVTLEQLLSHRGGIPPFEDEEEAVWKALPKLAGTPVEVRRKFSEWIMQRGAATPVGEHVYSNAGYCLAASMAERVTGKSWEALMKERLFAKAGMKTAGFGWPASVDRLQPWGHREKDSLIVPHPPDDDYQLDPFIDPAGDIHMTIGDFATYAQMHLAGLRGAPRVLKAASFAKLHEPIGDYALGWNRQVVRNLPASTHSGSAGTFYAGIMVYPQKDIAIVIFINISNKRSNEARNKLFGVLLRKYGAIS